MSDPLLDRAIASVADGTAADWDLLAKDAKTDDERSWLECVRILGEISAFHSSGSASSAVADSTVVVPARMWGRYRLLEQVGQGSFASVHRAWDPELEREVALKILHRRVVDDVTREKLLREGRALARIRHPRVVQVLGVEAHEDELALCMEFVHGQTLEDVLKNNRGTMSAREAALVGGDLCRALAAVHAAGFVHRDVKARNVMRETGGRIVLMDFGASSDAAPHIGALRTVGTPLYLAPELINGGPASRAGDIYALGVLLFYLVTRDFPVQGTSLEELREGHAKNRRRHIRDVRPDLPEPFVRVVEAATAIRPEDRPESPGAMESLLAQLVEAPIQVSSLEARQRSVAVLPFVDASSLGSLQYFCDGMAEELSNALAAVPGLRVIARGSSSRFRTAMEDVRQIGTMLNVGAVLEGSVRAVGNQLRVVSRLVDTSDGAQVWSERFDRRLDDVFAVQDEIARAVVEALRLHGVRAPREETPGTPGTRDFEAYTLYLKGRHHWNKRTEESLHKSVGYFRSAVDRDPDYAEAHAGLASAEATLGLYGAMAPSTVMPDAKKSAERALALKPALSGALATCGCVTGTYEWAWSEAERFYRRAVELNPSDSDAQHWYAINHLVPLGRFDEARLALDRAAEADPLSVPITASAGLLAYFAHQYDAAYEGLQRGLELDPHAATPRLFLGLTHVETGKHVDAIRELETAMGLTRKSPEAMAALGYAYARAGHSDRAAAAIAELTALSGSRYVSPSLIAQIHAGLGDGDAALEWLDRAFEVRAADLAWLAVRPVFNPLRAEARFKALLERLGMPGAPAAV